MNRNYIDKLCDKIILETDAKEAVNGMLNKKAIMIESLASQVWSTGNFKVLQKEMKHFGNDRYLLALCTVLAMTERTADEYKKLDIGDDVFFDTMSDIGIWSENLRKETGLIGIENVNWIINHLKANIFRLGRLQFQITHARLPHFCTIRERLKSHVHNKDRILFVHIPQGEKLTPNECDKSFDSAKDFFATHFPKFEYKFFVTESWLIHPSIKNVVDSDSNILAFQRRFRIVATSQNIPQPYERIWGEKKNNIDEYSEDTSLQRDAKRYLKNGGNLGVAYGYIEK